MTDREICEKIVKDNGCSDSTPRCSLCPLNPDCKDYTYSFTLAKQWLKDHTPYTYAEVDLPEWWDGRPIRGIAGYHIACQMYTGYCIGYDHVTKRYCVRIDNPSCISKPYVYSETFEPITTKKTDATCTIVLTKDGKTKEIELTDEQIKELGL